MTRFGTKAYQLRFEILESVTLGWGRLRTRHFLVEFASERGSLTLSEAKRSISSSKATLKGDDPTLWVPEPGHAKP